MVLASGGHLLREKPNGTNFGSRNFLGFYNHTMGSMMIKDFSFLSFFLSSFCSLDFFLLFFLSTYMIYSIIWLRISLPQMITKTIYFQKI